MSRGTPVPEDVRVAVEDAVRLRITAPRDKELLAKFKISRATLHRIMRLARAKLMRQLSHSIESKETQNRES